MAINENSYHPLTFRREETRPMLFVFRPRDKSLPPFNLSGKTIQLRIKPHGESEIIFNSPEISITNAVGGEFTIAIPGATVTAWTFQTAPYAILLDGKRILYGDITVKSVYE